MTVSLGGVPPALVLIGLGVLVVFLPLALFTVGRRVIEALHDRGGRASRVLTAVSDWFSFSTPPASEGRTHRRPGIHQVRRRIVLDSIVVTVRRTCDAYRALGLDTLDERLPPARFAATVGRRSDTRDLLRTLQAELRELSTYETGTAALRLPHQPTYDELLRLRTTLTRLHQQPG
ncbi:hypothetical protein [Isoptericola sp. BMS4]|uniref:hypothetical protein n=1 Tax=Isoptericola sp. BMS4 TaxID=2527875 RepID=UPI00141F1153|nr:hypothetical protein [Isoptericola sp. BMS4]